MTKTIDRVQLERDAEQALARWEKKFRAYFSQMQQRQGGPDELAVELARVFYNVGINGTRKMQQSSHSYELLAAHAGFLMGMACGAENADFAIDGARRKIRHLLVP